MGIKPQDIKDYLHLYIGSLIQYPDTDGSNIIAKFTGLTLGDGIETTYLEVLKPGEMKGDYLGWRSNGNHNSDALNAKLILRKLSDMTEEEKEEFGRFTDEQWPKRGDGVGERLIPSKERGALWAANQTKWDTSRYFDVFGLIPAGLAIDKTSLKN